MASPWVYHSPPMSGTRPPILGGHRSFSRTWASIGKPAFLFWKYYPLNLLSKVLESYFSPSLVCSRWWVTPGKKWSGVPFLRTYVPHGYLTFPRPPEQRPLDSSSATNWRQGLGKSVLGSSPPVSQQYHRQRPRHYELPSGYLLTTVMTCLARARLHFSPHIMRTESLVFSRDLLSISLYTWGLMIFRRLANLSNHFLASCASNNVYPWRGNLPIN